MSSPPRDLDDESLRRIARSFYVARMVRYALLVVALVAVAAISAAEDAPGVVPVVLVVVAVLLLAAMVAVRRRYLGSQVSAQRPPGGASPTSR